MQTKTLTECPLGSNMLCILCILGNLGDGERGWGFLSLCVSCRLFTVFPLLLHRAYFPFFSLSTIHFCHTLSLSTCTAVIASCMCFFSQVCFQFFLLIVIYFIHRMSLFTCTFLFAFFFLQSKFSKCCFAAII